MKKNIPMSLAAIFLLVSLVCAAGEDTDDNGVVSLNDPVMALQIEAGLRSGESGLKEAVSALQIIAGKGSVNMEWTRTPGTVQYAYLRVPSAACWDHGIAVYVAFPGEAEGARYKKGAPVIIEVPGGTDQGSLPPPGDPGYAAIGAISVHFLLPGGMTGQYESGGIYDYRGLNCIRACTDVIRFVQGKTTALPYDGGDPLYLTDIISYPVLNKEIGIMALSNGGNLATISLGKNGGLMDAIAWYAGWENPPGDQFVNVELNEKTRVNPYYSEETCFGEICEVDYSRICMDTSFQDEIRDAGAQDSDNAETILVPRVFFDDDEDQKYDPGEFIIWIYAYRLTQGGPLKGVVSVETAQALENKGYDLAAWNMATLAETSQFWSLREAAAQGGWWDAVMSHFPDLRAMVLANATDHIQKAGDHPHIKVQLDGWANAGISFLRYNPDEIYWQAMGGTEGVDNPASSAYSWDMVISGAQPGGVTNTDMLILAGAAEMADRTHADNWSANLDAVLWQNGERKNTTPVYVTCGSHIELNLPFPNSNCAEFERYRNNLLEYAALFSEFGVKWNLQTNATFAILVQNCETEAMRENTQGMRIFPYIFKTFDVRIDPHTHEYDLPYNYTDVFALLRNAGIPAHTMTVVGGFNSGDASQFAAFENGRAGAEFPDVTWRPQVYSFAGLYGHPVEYEDFTSGVWKPSDFDLNPLDGQMGEMYYTHHPTKTMMVAGMGFLHSGELGYESAYFCRASDYVRALCDKIEQGIVPVHRIYTATLATNQKHLNDPDTYLPLVRKQLEDLEPYKDSGKIRYVHFQDIPGLWNSYYNSEPNQLLIDSFEGDHTSCNGL